MIGQSGRISLSRFALKFRCDHDARTNRRTADLDDAMCYFTVRIPYEIGDDIRIEKIPQSEVHAIERQVLDRTEIVFDRQKRFQECDE